LTISAGILGATGYTGAELIRLLYAHPEVKIAYCSSRQHNGRKVSDILEFLKGTYEAVLEEFDAESITTRCDAVFSCLPHGASMGYISRIVPGVRVIDLSADFRIKDPATYSLWYAEHGYHDLLDSAVYGLSEVYREQIKSAQLVANPGCYPTSVLLPLVPLLESNLIDPYGIIVDSKSGVSGAGRGLSLKTHICEVGESFSAYKVGRAHRHIPEMEQELTRAAKKSITMDFIPHLLPITRGMLSTIYLRTTRSEKELRECLKRYYETSPFVNILSDSFPSTKDVRGTNRCIIALAKVEPTDRVVIVSVIDNLTKGASGQAVQNMNIMFGFDENAGLDSIPLFP